MAKLEFDTALIQRYDLTGPRYTSYPTALQFTPGFSREDYQKQIEQGNRLHTPLSLYFHLPFCDTICYYCACNKIVTKNRKRAQPYLDHLHHEIRLQAELFTGDRKVEQLHWGGGTPTFISHTQMQQLMQVTREHFQLCDDNHGEYSIEIDPREANAETIALLRELGFNRLSLGVQDIDPQVQRAVNRLQSIEQTATVIEAARQHNFHSISLDLIYGLPHQTVEGFAQTLKTVLALSPDRLSVFNYAHLPEMFKTQRQINPANLPNAATRLAILEHTIQTLSDNGYMYIGMDHFARPDDELAIAQTTGSLHRNFQGYSTHADCDMIGMGVTSIGRIHDSYSQNHRSIDDYGTCLEKSQLPLWRGLVLDADDKLRRTIITELICHFRLDISTIEERFAIRFDQYFSEALTYLGGLQEDGLLELTTKEIQVSAKGTLFIRNICMAFDRYLDHSQQRYSRVI